MKKYVINSVSQGILWPSIFVFLIFFVYLSVAILPNSFFALAGSIIVSLILSWIISKILSKYVLEITINNGTITIKQVSGLLFRFKSMDFHVSEVQDFFEEKGLMNYFTLKVNNYNRVMIYNELGDDINSSQYDEMLAYFQKNVIDNYKENERYEDRGKVSLFQTKSGTVLAYFFLHLGIFILYLFFDMPAEDSTEFIERLLLTIGCFSMFGYYLYARSIKN